MQGSTFSHGDAPELHLDEIPPFKDFETTPPILSCYDPSTMLSPLKCKLDSWNLQSKCYKERENARIYQIILPNFLQISTVFFKGDKDGLFTTLVSPKKLALFC